MTKGNKPTEWEPAAGTGFRYPSTSIDSRATWCPVLHFKVDAKDGTPCPYDYCETGTLVFEDGFTFCTCTECNEEFRKGDINGEQVLIEVED